MKNTFVALNVVNIDSNLCVKAITVKFVNTSMILEVSEEEYYTSRLNNPISCVCIINGEEYLVLGTPEEIICEIRKEEKAQLC